MQEAYQREPWDPQGERGGEENEGAGKLSCNAVSVEGSANPTGGFEAEMSLQSSLDLGQGGQVFIFHINQSLDMNCPWMGDVTLVKLLSSVKAIPIRGL